MWRIPVQTQDSINVNQAETRINRKDIQLKPVSLLPVAPSGKKWVVQSMLMLHITGSDSQLTLQNNDGNPIFQNLIAAAAATSSNVVDLGKVVNFIIYSSDQWSYTGDATAYTILRVLEYED